MRSLPIHPKCIFCAIVSGQLEASKIYQDDVCVAFMDIHPLSDGHALVVPHRHVVFLHELSHTERRHLFDVAQQILNAQRGSGLACEGANFLVNDGQAANQHIQHVHLHVVPRVRGDVLKMAWRFSMRMFNFFGRKAQRHKLNGIALRLRNQLSLSQNASQTEREK